MCLRAAALAAVGWLAVACAGPTPSAHLDLGVQPLHAGKVVDGVPCLTDEIASRHIHVHLAVFMNGRPVVVPAGIGVGRPWGQDGSGFIGSGTCFAWMHTHDASGVVHILSPVDSPFTLDQLFNVWGHPLARDSVFGFHGSVAVFVYGRPVSGDPRALPLLSLENIVVELGSAPAQPPPALYDFAALRY